MAPIQIPKAICTANFVATEQALRTRIMRAPVAVLEQLIWAQAEVKRPLLEDPPPPRPQPPPRGALVASHCSLLC